MTPLSAPPVATSYQPTIRDHKIAHWTDVADRTIVVANSTHVYVVPAEAKRVH